MNKILKISLIFIFFAFFITTVDLSKPVFYAKASAENNISISSKAGILYDMKTGSVIYEKNSEERLPIASMTKIASLMMIFDAIENGELKEDDLVVISKFAADTEGSSAFLDEKSSYKVSDLIMTVIVCSANDSTVALAEKLCGSEDKFVKKLNEKVREMGLKNTNFINSTGLPALDHYSSASDISKIYVKICDNPIYKKYSKIWMTDFVHPSKRKTNIVNTNRLIKTYEGCDSGKTGFTNDAGFCLSASATRGDMRLVGVIIGADSSKTRFNEMANMFDYGFENYENRTIIKSDNPIYEISLKNSLDKKALVYPENDFVKFLEKGEDFKYSLDYKIDVNKAPIKANEKVGLLYVLDKNNIVVHEEPLIVRDNIDELKIKDILKMIYSEML